MRTTRALLRCAAADLFHCLDGKHLSARYQKLGERDAVAVLGHFLKGHDVTSVDLRHNELGEAGGRRVVEILRQHCNNLAQLDLRANELHDSGVAAVGSLLFGVPIALRSLNLWNNRCHPDGARRLGIALRKNRSLESLAMGANLLEDDGFDELALALAKHPQLTSLDVRSSYIGDAGVSGKGLLSLVRGAPALQTLCLRNNQIADAGVSSIIAALVGRADAGCSALATLDLHGCWVSPRGLAALREFVAGGSGVPRRIILQSQQSDARLNVMYDADAGGWSDDGDAQSHRLRAADTFSWDSR